MEINNNLKNSNDKIRNNQFMSLSPTIVEKLDKVYVDALDFVIENENIKNAAISGHYGSGKSSIWQTYKNMRNINNVIYISLGDYCEGDEEGNSISRIEKQILTQILTQVNQKDIPLSKYKLKSNKNKCTIAKYLLASFSFIVSILGWLVKAEITSAYMVNMEEYLRIIFILFVLPLLYLLYRIFKGELFQISKINLKIAEANAQTSEEKDESIFDKDIKEIIYILESSNVKYVVFEDLDRYDNVLIFSKMRELNFLLNSTYDKKDSILRKMIRYLKSPFFKKNGEIGNNIKFIYLVRDDLFDIQTRSKFFDFILPVIPIVDSENSEGKLIEYFKDNNNIPDKKVLRKISIFIDDMRVLKNIVNEYNIYSEILLSQKLNLDKNKLFSIIVLKNIFPEEFSLLQRDRGYIFNIFRNLPNYKEKMSKEIKEEIIVSEDNFAKWKKELANDKFEVITLMLPGNLSTGDGDVRWSEYLKDWSKKENESRVISGYRLNYTRFLEKFIYNNKNNIITLDKWEKTRAIEIEILKNKIRNLYEEYDSVQELTLKELLNSIDDIELTKIFENKDVTSVIVNSHYFPLIKFLLIAGLIDESYKSYLGLFREGSKTSNDKIFISNILSAGKSNLFLNISSPKTIYEELENYHYQRKAILNLKFLEWLIENDKKIKVMKVTSTCLNSDLILVLSKLSKENVKTYCEIFLEKDKKLLSEILQISIIYKYEELLENVILSILKYEFESEKELKMFSHYISSSESVLIWVGSILKEFSRNLNYGIIKFNDICIEGLDEKVLKIIIEKNAYKITINNIKFILETRLEGKVDLGRLFSIISQQKDINKYVNENLLEFLNQYTSSDIDIFNDDEENVISILKSELELNSKIAYIKKNSTILTDISYINDIDGMEELLRILILNNTLQFNEDNISLYWRIIGEIDDQLIKYLEANLREDNKDIILENDDLYFELTNYKNISDKILNLLRVNEVEE